MKIMKGAAGNGILGQPPAESARGRGRPPESTSRMFNLMGDGGGGVNCTRLGGTWIGKLAAVTPLRGMNPRR